MTVHVLGPPIDGPAGRSVVVGGGRVGIVWGADEHGELIAPTGTAFDRDLGEPCIPQTGRCVPNPLGVNEEALRYFADAECQDQLLDASIAGGGMAGGSVPEYASVREPNTRIFRVDGERQVEALFYLESGHTCQRSERDPSDGKYYGVVEELPHEDLPEVELHDRTD